MSAISRRERFEGVLLRLLVGVVTVTAAGVAVVASDLTVWSASPVGVVLGGGFATVTAVAERVGPLQAVFERGQWLVTIGAIAVTFLFVYGVVAPEIILGVAVGIGLGSAVGAAFTLSLAE